MITKTMKGLAHMMMLIDHAVMIVTTLPRKMCFFFCIHVGKENVFFFCIHKQFQFLSNFVHIGCSGYES